MTMAPRAYDPARRDYGAEEFSKVCGRHQYRRDRAENILRRTIAPEFSDFREFLAALRAIGPYAWPGGHSVLYLASDGGTLCYDCARKNARLICEAIRDHDSSGWRVVTYYVHWEGPPEFCANCNSELPSEYGDPETEQ